MRALAISAPKSTITLFTPQFAQSETHPQVTLNNSILHLEKTACMLGVTFDPHFKVNAYIKSIVDRASPRINILMTLVSRESPASCPFLLRCPSLLSGGHCHSEVGFSFLSSLLSLLPFSILKLLLLLSDQYPNPGPAYSCSICNKPFNTKQHSFLCSLCKAWVHFKC